MDSNFWIVSLLIIPRSATIHTNPIPNRLRNRSIIGIRVSTSAVLPGHSSQQIGCPSPSSTAPTTICFKSGRWSLLLPRRPSLSPPSPSKYSEVVSKNTNSKDENRSLLRANNFSSITSFVHRGVKGPASLCPSSANSSPNQAIAR